VKQFTRLSSKAVHDAPVIGRSAEEGEANVAGPSEMHEKGRLRDRLLVSMQFNGSASTPEGNKDAKRLNYEADAIATEIESRLGHALSRVVRGCRAEVRIHFQGGSVIWGGLVTFFAVSGAIGSTVQLFQYAEALVGWTVDRVVGEHLQNGVVGATKVTIVSGAISAPAAASADAPWIGPAGVVLGVVAVAIAVAAFARG
jgi:hypothetical protein